MSTKPTRRELVELTHDFTEAFNREDLDAVMSHFALHGAVYDQFNGQAAEGLSAIREALVPQFRGDFGTMRFLEEDAFYDPDSRKSLISWTCTLSTSKGPAGWRGLDILHFDGGGKVAVKQTYAKTRSPLLDPKAGGN